MARLPISVATITAGAAIVLGLLVAAFSLPIDDFWLSLASAHAIQRGAPLGEAVDLTWTPTLRDALNPQWLAQLVLGLPGSTWGALAINALLIGSGLMLMTIRAARVAGVAAVAVAGLLALAVLSPHLLARAQSFSILLLPLTLLLLDLRPRPRWLPLAVFGVMVAWANLHGAFVIGQVAVGVAYAAGLLTASDRRDWLLLSATAAGAVLAPLVNPAGTGLLTYAYAQPGLEVVRSISVEWQPAWPWVPVATLFWVYLALLIPGRVLRPRSASIGELLLGIALAGLAIGSLRQIPWFVIATVPILARDVDALLAHSSALGRAFGTVSPRLTKRGFVATAAACLVLAVAIQPLRVALPQSAGRVTPDAPVAIADALAIDLEEGDAARILNEQVWGGYLAYRFGARLETAMDGRLEIRDRATWAAYFTLLRGEGNPAMTLEAAGVDWAALAPDRSALIQALRSAGWSERLRTAQGVLLRAP